MTAISKEQADPLIEAMQQVAEAMFEFVEVAISIAKCVEKELTSIWEQVIQSYATATHPKWLHYHKCSKKHRVRKKYYNLIKREFYRQLLLQAYSTLEICGLIKNRRTSLCQGKVN